MSFYKWACDQAGRGDIIGDVCNDILMDNEYPVNGGFESQLKYLASHPLGKNVTNLFRIAWEEFLSSDRKRRIGNGIRFNVLRRDGYKCQICGMDANDGVKLEVDHKIPVSKGGGDEIENLWTLCFNCNRGKKDKYL